MLLEHSSVTLRSAGTSPAARHRIWCRGDWLRGAHEGRLTAYGTAPTRGTVILRYRVSATRTEPHAVYPEAHDASTGCCRCRHQPPCLARLAARRLGICSSKTTRAGKANLPDLLRHKGGGSLSVVDTTGMPHPAPPARGSADR